MTLWAGNGLFRSTGCAEGAMPVTSARVDQYAILIADRHIALSNAVSGEFAST